MPGTSETSAIALTAGTNSAAVLSGRHMDFSDKPHLVEGRVVDHEAIAREAEVDARQAEYEAALQKKMLEDAERRKARHVERPRPAPKPSNPYDVTEDEINEEVENSSDLRELRRRQGYDRLGEKIADKGMKFLLKTLAKRAGGAAAGAAVDSVWPAKMGGQDDVMGRSYQDPESAEFQARLRILERRRQEAKSTPNTVVPAVDPFAAFGFEPGHDAELSRANQRKYEENLRSLKRLMNAGKIEPQHDDAIARENMRKFENTLRAYERTFNAGNFEPKHDEVLAQKKSREFEDMVEVLRATSRLENFEPQYEARMVREAERRLEAEKAALKPLVGFGFTEDEVDDMAFEAVYGVSKDHVVDEDERFAKLFGKSIEEVAFEATYGVPVESVKTKDQLFASFHGKSMEELAFEETFGVPISAVKSDEERFFDMFGKTIEEVAFEETYGVSINHLHRNG